MLEIIDRLLTFVSYNELKNYDKATDAAREALEMSARLHNETFRRTPEGVKWFRSAEYRAYKREVRREKRRQT